MAERLISYQQELELAQREWLEYVPAHVYGSEEAIPDDSVYNIETEREYILFKGEGSPINVIFGQERRTDKTFDYITLARDEGPFFCLQHTIDNWQSEFIGQKPKPNFHLLLHDMMAEILMEDGAFVDGFMNSLKEAKAEGKLRAAPST